MSKKRPKSLRSVTIRISITGGTAVSRNTPVRWRHYQYNLCGHICIPRYKVRLHLTQFISPEITFIARAKFFII